MATSPAYRNAWDPLRTSVNYWRWASRVGEIWWTRLNGLAAIEAARRRRFLALVQFARARSAFYRDAYRLLPGREPDIGGMPVVTKRELMTRFDDWVTDPAVTRAGVEAFLDDRTNIGERYLNRYIVWKSSGSTGEPGIYVQDPDALTTFDALMAVHLDPARMATRYAWEFLTRGGRAALVVTTGEHFASIASWQRVCQSNPGLSARGFSILAPLPQLVAELNAYRPAFLASYPTMLSLLADEQKAGRLRIAREEGGPIRVQLGDELERREDREAAGRQPRLLWQTRCHDAMLAKCSPVATTSAARPPRVRNSTHSASPFARDRGAPPSAHRTWSAHRGPGRPGSPVCRALPDDVSVEISLPYIRAIGRKRTSTPARVTAGSVTQSSKRVISSALGDDRHAPNY